MDVRAGCPCRNAYFSRVWRGWPKFLAGRRPQGISGPKLPLWTDFSFLILGASDERPTSLSRSVENEHTSPRPLKSLPRAPESLSGLQGAPEKGCPRPRDAAETRGWIPRPRNLPWPEAWRSQAKKSLRETFRWRIRWEIWGQSA